MIFISSGVSVGVFRVIVVVLEVEVHTDRPFIIIVSFAFRVRMWPVEFNKHVLFFFFSSHGYA